jgi:hypothetical protein
MKEVYIFSTSVKLTIENVIEDCCIISKKKRADRLNDWTLCVHFVHIIQRIHGNFCAFGNVTLESLPVFNPANIYAFT